MAFYSRKRTYKAKKALKMTGLLQQLLSDRRRVNTSLIILCVLLFVQNLSVSLNGNLMLLFGAIFQTDYGPAFPQDLLESYGRGIAYKAMLYVLYKLNNVVLGEWIVTKSEPLVKFLYYAFWLGFSYFSLTLIKDKIKKAGYSILTIFLLFTLFVLLSSHRQILEASETAIFLALGMLCFAFSRYKIANLLSGIFVPILFGLKGITFLYAGFPFVFLLFNYHQNKQQFYYFTVSGVVFALLTVLAYFTIFSIEIQNLQEQSIYQSAFKFKSTTLPLFGAYALFNLGCIPILFAGVFLPIVVVYQLLKTKNFKHLSLFILLFSLPAAYVIIQHKWLPYNYVVFTPVILSLLLYSWRFLSHKIALNITFMSIAGSLIFYLGTFLLPGYKLNKVFEDYCNKCRYNDYYFQKDYQIFEKLKANYDIEEQPHLLFLTSGIAPYHLKVKSFFTQINPLPLQRIAQYPHIKETSQYKNMLEGTLNYEGKYIVLDPQWLNITLIPELVEKLNVEYEEVEKLSSFNQKSIILFRRK